MVGRDIILQNAGWAVGNGVDLNVWDAPWLSLSSQTKPMGPPPEALVNLTVADLFLDGINSWDLEKVQRYLPFHEQEILAIKPSLSGAPNKLIWIKDPSGEFTTKSGYASARNRIAEVLPVTAPIGDFNWQKNIWKVHTAPKLKLFLWKTFHNALPTGDQLIARQIAVDGKCKSCGQPESIDHLFLHCNFAQHVWNNTPVTPTFDTRGSLDLKSAWTALLSTKALPPTGVAEGPLAPWILWQLWIERNNLVFSDKRSSAIEVVSKATAAAREWFQAQVKEDKPKKKIYCPPQISQVAVTRTDAAWNEARQLAGLGGTIEHSAGSESFAVPASHVKSPLLAEGLAVREALLQCRDLGIARIRCESDSTTLVKILNSETTNSELYGVASDILSLASSFEIISFVWIPRERNFVADGLAKQVLSVELAIHAAPNSG